MLFLGVILFIIIVTAVSLCLSAESQRDRHIAVVQFDKRQFDPQLEENLWSIADWYEFQNTADADFEIQDLKNNYKIVLEIR